MLGLTAFYHAITERSGGMEQGIGVDGRAMVTLQANRSGHYVAEGEINGQPVVFLLDTGATDVAISDKTARALGLEFGPRITVMTAAGPAVAWRTRLDRVSLGSLALSDVRATITPGLGREALLGMSFLKYFNLRQEGDRLVLQGGSQKG
ncbi:MAG: TIGR02281 family clan AA aspartic protease [Xanthomonadales bacterium]|nr:TIGR02281 family clan AA aspartic protease [Gammaproteobacteria bacterium]MBT8055152.1 TIGR02281 family clan AA aspartic protease [Gammaproteobacteria bacterium]NND58359.1 TIGR02281 family clan AA aspartic protease [Xanthomonadales bacterium]NNK51746.1 TIGR02281 family clan AA aspartic protease [Xanthomonadales bacterium]